jgi:DNA excision repair protein ERCC-1
MFLSCRYHVMNPDYIHQRLRQLGKNFDLRLLLVLVDLRDCQRVLSDLAKIAILSDLSLVLAWSSEEAAHYLEMYKAFEHKPVDVLKEKLDSDLTSRAVECLSTVRKVNRTDASTLLNNFKVSANRLLCVLL